MSWLNTVPLPPCMVDSTCTYTRTDLIMDFPSGPQCRGCGFNPWLEVRALIHNFFMHSCLGYCRKMLQWTWKYRYLFKILFSLPLDIYPELELLVHMIAVFLSFLFWRTSMLFSKETEPLYIAIDSVSGFLFLYILTNICYVLSFW